MDCIGRPRELRPRQGPRPADRTEHAAVPHGPCARRQGNGGPAERRGLRCASSPGTVAQGPKPATRPRSRAAAAPRTTTAATGTPSWPKVGNRLFPYDRSQAPTFNDGPAPAKGTPGAGGPALVNVRIGDGGHLTVPMRTRRGGRPPGRRPGTGPPPPGHGKGRQGRRRRVRGTAGRVPGSANDLPATDRTGTLTARAENDEDAIIGPVASPTLRPRDARRDDITDINDGFDANGLGLADACIVGFTALKQAAERWVVPTAQQPEAERVTGRPDIPGARHTAGWGQRPAREGGPACGEAVSWLTRGLPFGACRRSRGPWLSMGRWPCPRAPRSSATGRDRRALRMGVPATTFTAGNAPRPQVGAANRAAKAVRVARRRAARESEPEAPDGPSPVPRIPPKNGSGLSCIKPEQVGASWPLKAWVCLAIRRHIGWAKRA